jgi:AAA15 family ATPase/GTPase
MLKKLELHNFKSHRSTQLHFNNSQLQAIVGQNSSGKTSVLQALQYLADLSAPENSDDARKNIEIIGENNITIGADKMYFMGSGTREIEN